MPKLPASPLNCPLRELEFQTAQTANETTDRECSINYSVNWKQPKDLANQLNRQVEIHAINFTNGMAASANLLAE